MSSDIQQLEADLCSAALTAPEVCEIQITGAQFDSPTLGAIWDALVGLHRDGIRPDPSTVVERAKPARVDHHTIVELVDRPVVAANSPIIANRISDEYQRRQLGLALISARQGLDSGNPLDEIVQGLSRQVGVSTQAEDDVAKAMTLDEFCDQPLPPNDWIIPGLLARGDRMILTGSEGAGKSILQRQFAVCTAAGVHPFTEERFKPKRVLVIDAENPLRIMVNTYNKIRQAVRTLGADTGTRLWIRRFPQGMDLGSTRDRLRLAGLIRTLSPDLLVIGPAYKLYVGGSNSREEDIARRVTATLDGLREEYNFALILEHHSPHAAPGMQRDVRPIGSSLWMRWPEFGMGIRLYGDQRDHRQAEVVQWRGMREDRPWPEKIEQGPRLPWIQQHVYMEAA